MQKKYWLLFIIILVIIGCGFAFKLPKVNIPEASVLYDVNGEVIKGLGEQSRISVNLQSISPYFTEAVIAVEDKRFYSHVGVDPIGIGRALITNLKHGKVMEGGSTLTQQTAKLLYLQNDRTILRKVKDAFYALQLERYYSKDEILNMYCNVTYFGHGAYGVEVASRIYFAKSAAELTIAEAALLAGLPQSPSYYDPYVNPEAAKKRQETVLDRMYEQSYITEEEKELALNEPLKYSSTRFISGEAPYFTAMVREYLIEKYGESLVYQGGLEVYTTLDLTMQRAANQAVENGLSGKDEALQAALVAIEPGSGYIKALVGGRNYAASNYNRAYSKRQPGSTVKPFMYALALENGYTEASLFMCEEQSYHLPEGTNYTPKDYGKEPYHWRELTMKEAVMRSDNVIAVYVNSVLGASSTARYMEAFGLEKPPPYLSLPLGSIEESPMTMAAGYAVLASGGTYAKPMYILKVVDRDGRVLESHQPVSYTVISKEIAYLITDMLLAVMEPGGTASHLKGIAGRPAAAKTGTTDEYNDAWMLGYTPEIACAVWVGFDKERTVNLAGGTVAGPIWANFIHDGLVKTPVSSFTKPDVITTMNICMETGLIAVEACPWTTLMNFLPGTEPEHICWKHALRWNYQEWFEENSRASEEESDYDEEPIFQEDWWGDFWGSQ